MNVKDNVKDCIVMTLIMDGWGFVLIANCVLKERVNDRIYKYNISKVDFGFGFNANVDIANCEYWKFNYGRVRVNCWNDWLLGCVDNIMIVGCVDNCDNKQYIGNGVQLWEGKV